MGLLSAILGESGEPAPEVGNELVEKLILEVAAMSDNEELFLERIAELELAIEDTEWTRIGAGMSDGFQFNREALDKIIYTSRLYALKNPVIKRPVDLQAYYVWAQGVSIHAEGDLDEIVQGFLKDPANRLSFTGHDAKMDMEKRVRVDGNLFLRLFTNPSTGRVKVRKIPVEEVRAVVHNPEDRDEPWFYVRKFMKGTVEKKVAYPDWRYARQRKIDAKSNERDIIFQIQVSRPADLPEDVVIEWDTPVMHRKVGGFGDMDFGIPETYAAIDWAKAYKSALEDYKKTIRSLATWAWKMKMGGGQAQLNAAAQMLGTTFGNTTGDDQWSESNPTPPKGAAFAYTGDMDMRAIDVSKAAVDPDGFRRLLLMAASAMGMPEIYYGAAEGNFATAKSMDRPTELQFLDRQSMWAEIYTDVITFAIEAAAQAPKNDKVTSSGYDETNGLMKLRAGGKEVDIDLEVDFPPILQVDVQSWMQALVGLLTLNGQALQTLNDGPTIYRMALTALGVDNVEEIIEIFYPKDGSEPTNKEIKTYEPPLSPEDVEEDLQKQLDDNKAKAEKQAQASADAAARMAAGPRGAQPTNQGPAGGNNKAPQSRGGQAAVAREADILEDPEFRKELVSALTELRREALAAVAGAKE